MGKDKVSQLYIFALFLLLLSVNVYSIDFVHNFTNSTAYQSTAFSSTLKDAFEDPFYTINGSVHRQVFGGLLGIPGMYVNVTSTGVKFNIGPTSTNKYFCYAIDFCGVDGCIVNDNTRIEISATRLSGPGAGATGANSGWYIGLWSKKDDLRSGNAGYLNQTLTMDQDWYGSGADQPYNCTVGKTIGGWPFNQTVGEIRNAGGNCSLRNDGKFQGFVYCDYTIGQNQIGNLASFAVRGFDYTDLDVTNNLPTCDLDKEITKIMNLERNVSINYGLNCTDPEGDTIYLKRQSFNMINDLVFDNMQKLDIFNPPGSYIDIVENECSFFGWINPFCIPDINIGANATDQNMQFLNSKYFITGSQKCDSYICNNLMQNSEGWITVQEQENRYNNYIKANEETEFSVINYIKGYYQATANINPVIYGNGNVSINDMSFENGLFDLLLARDGNFTALYFDNEMKWNATIPTETAGVAFSLYIAMNFSTNSLCIFNYGNQVTWCKTIAPNSTFLGISYTVRGATDQVDLFNLRLNSNTFSGYSINDKQDYSIYDPPYVDYFTTIGKRNIKFYVTDYNGIMSGKERLYETTVEIKDTLIIPDDSNNIEQGKGNIEIIIPFRDLFTGLLNDTGKQNMFNDWAWIIWIANAIGLVILQKGDGVLISFLGASGLSALFGLVGLYSVANTICFLFLTAAFATPFIVTIFQPEGGKIR